MQSKYYSLSCYSTSVMKWYVLLSYCFVCVKVMMFTFYITSHLCICIHLCSSFSFVMSQQQQRQAILCQVKLEIAKRLQKFGSFEDFCCFSSALFHVFLFIVIFIGVFFFLVSKSTSWVKYIECGSTQALLFFILCNQKLISFSSVFYLQCTQRFYYTCSKQKKKNSLLINAFFSV